MRDNVIIPPDRLADAADAVLLGLAEMGTAHAGRLPSNILGTPEQPLAFCDFTRAEIVAAEHFLLRCGLFTPSAGGTGSIHDQNGAA